MSSVKLKNPATRDVQVNPNSSSRACKESEDSMKIVVGRRTAGVVDLATLETVRGWTGPASCFKAAPALRVLGNLHRVPLTSAHRLGSCRPNPQCRPGPASRREDATPEQAVNPWQGLGFCASGPRPWERRAARSPARPPSESHPNLKTHSRRTQGLVRNGPWREAEAFLVS